MKLSAPLTNKSALHCFSFSPIVKIPCLRETRMTSSQKGLKMAARVAPMQAGESLGKQLHPAFCLHPHAQ